MKQLIRVPALLVIGIIRLYQLSLARMMPQRCRFHPSCSEYAVGSLRENGLIRGGMAAGWRVVRCGPWNRGGLDPVKARGSVEGAARG
ncbi:MAG: membrane protein insertion efficiency factor YidD [Actinomycetota bacterium]